MILDVLCIVVVIVMCAIGFVQGFAKFILGMFNGLVAFVGAYFLFMPVYGLLYTLFIEQIISSLGSPIIAEYVAMLIVYVLLSFAIAIGWKFLKKLICKIFELPLLRTINKIAGIVLGVFYGVAISFILLYVWNFIGTASFIPESVATPVLNALNQMSASSVIAKPVFINNFDWFTDLLIRVIDTIIYGYNG